MGLLLGSGNTKPQYPYDQWYGVQGDFTSKDYKLTRVGNLDLHRSLPIQKLLRRFVENEDGSVKYYLHQNDSRLRDGGAAATIDSTDGNVMLEKPDYYLKVEIVGTKWLYAISQYPLPGFIKMERKTVAPWYSTIDQANKKAVSGCWLTWDGNDIARDENGIPILTSNAANFRGGNGSDAAKDGTYNSMLGMARTSISKAGVRPYCLNGTHIGVYRAYNEIAWLQRIEYASLHCQATYTATLTADGYHQGGLGSGCSVDWGQWSKHNGNNPFVPCGVTAPLGNNTGKVQFTIKNWQNGGTDKVVDVTSYRGLEVPYEYLWMLADDLLVWHDGVKSTIYLCEDPTKFVNAADNAKAAPDGYEPIAQLPLKEDWILVPSISLKGYTFPAQGGGSANTGMCDRFYTAFSAGEDKGWYGALLAAYATYGATAGFGCLGTFARSSHAIANVGFRLCRF